jgi:hypothetical protein
MTAQQSSQGSFVALCCALICSCLPVLSQSLDRSLTHKATTEMVMQKDQFIAALEWSVEKQTNYVWPFESIKPAPFRSVRMLVEQMPRAWPEKGSSRGSISLSAHSSLKVNGNRLPKPQRRGSGEEFRVYLEKGRLRFSFSLPSGFKLDPQDAIIRISLYRAD